MCRRIHHCSTATPLSLFKTPATPLQACNGEFDYGFQAFPPIPFSSHWSLFPLNCSSIHSAFEAFGEMKWQHVTTFWFSDSFDDPSEDHMMTLKTTLITLWWHWQLLGKTFWWPQWQYMKMIWQSMQWYLISFWWPIIMTPIPLVMTLMTYGKLIEYDHGSVFFSSL